MGYYMEHQTSGTMNGYCNISDSLDKGESDWTSNIVPAFEHFSKQAAARLSHRYVSYIHKLRLELLFHHWPGSGGLKIINRTTFFTTSHK
jgi:hypothetical protein